MIRVSKLTRAGDVAGGQVFQALNARVIFEDGMPQHRLPLPDHDQPLLGVLQAGLGLAQGFLLLGHRRVVVGPLLEIARERRRPAPCATCSRRRLIWSCQ